jgi:hypothetical protein
VFIYTEKTPTLTINFAGIGTRDLTEHGEEAIGKVYAEVSVDIYNEHMKGSGFRKVKDIL